MKIKLRINIIGIFALAAVALLGFTACKNTKGADTMLPQNCRQILVVTSDNPDTTNAKMAAYELINDKWHETISTIETRIGRTGMAWAPGLQNASFNTGTLKKEGDGKSPAGIFPIDGLYGYGDLTAKLDYIKVDENTFCVDDPKSRYYNQIVRGIEVEKDWNSAETMKMESDVYKYGIIVGYNTTARTAGAGSCIFFHLDSGSPTAGCTAMTEENILKVIEFLDKSKSPLIIQAPIGDYREMAKKYHLPSRD